MPGQPVYAAWARHRVAGLLVAVWGLGEATDDATPVAGELLNNGCLHGAGRVRVRARITTQSTMLCLTTPAPWREWEPGGEIAERESGRGLLIAACLVESIHFAPDLGGFGTSVTVVCRSRHTGLGSSEGGA